MSTIRLYFVFQELAKEQRTT